MNRLLSWCVAAAFSLSCSSTCAAVFERDWRTPGDGLLTYDDVNRREWLDLSVSRMDQFPVPWLDHAVAEFAPGGLFNGFRWAKRNDVISLAASAGIDITTLNTFPAENEIPVTELIELLGATLQLDLSFTITDRSTGFIDEIDDYGRQVGSELLVEWHPVTKQVVAAGMYISSFNDLLRGGSTGLLLHRAVPEPSASSLMPLWLFALGSVRRSPRVRN